MRRQYGRPEMDSLTENMTGCIPGKNIIQFIFVFFVNLDTFHFNWSLIASLSQQEI
jgi:hypothetical protein